MAREEPRMEPGMVRDGGDPFDWFLRIPNRLDVMSAVRALLGATCELHGVGEEARQEILLALSEIVNNAIEHVEGSGPGGYHEVDIWFGIGDGMAVGRVLDEGQGGIDQVAFEDATAPSLDSDRGRGLFLIKAYVDELRVTPVPGVGTEIRFVKRLPGGGGNE